MNAFSLSTFPADHPLVSAGIGNNTSAQRTVLRHTFLCGHSHTAEIDYGTTSEHLTTDSNSLRQNAPSG